MSRGINLMQKEFLSKVARNRVLTPAEIIELFASNDTLTKKLMCDYIVKRSSTHPTLGLLTGNILIKDCTNANPFIRSSSIMALSCLDGMEDIIVSGILKSMKDPSPQVRRAAAFSSLNLYYTSPSVVLSSGIVDCLYELIRDMDSIVITNCLFVLEKILSSEGSFTINRNIVLYLLSRISQFSDCSVVYVLNIIIQYKPKSEEETFEILNCLDSLFHSTTPSVLIAAMKCFLTVTKSYEKLEDDLSEIVKPAVCKILDNNIPETTYFFLNFLMSVKLDLCRKFEGDCRYFVLRAKDPVYLKMKKLEVLPLISTARNSKEIISNVRTYISDRNIYEEVFRCISVIGTVDTSSQELIMDTISISLRNSHLQIIKACLECLLNLIITNKENFNFEIKDKFQSLSKNHIEALDIVLRDPELQKREPILLLYTLGIIYSDLANSIEILDDFLCRFLDLESRCQCILISIITLIFITQPANTQYRLSTIIGKGMESNDPSLKSHSAFIYSVLEMGNFENVNFLTIFPSYSGTAN